MSSTDDQERSKYIMTLKNKTLSNVSVGWVMAKINYFKVKLAFYGENRPNTISILQPVDDS